MESYWKYIHQQLCQFEVLADVNWLHKQHLSWVSSSLFQHYQDSFKPDVMTPSYMYMHEGGLHEVGLHDSGLYEDGLHEGGL